MRKKRKVQPGVIHPLATLQEPISIARLANEVIGSKGFVITMALGTLILSVTYLLTCVMFQLIPRCIWSIFFSF